MFPPAYRLESNETKDIQNALTVALNQLEQMNKNYSHKNSHPWNMLDILEHASLIYDLAEQLFNARKEFYIKQGSN